MKKRLSEVSPESTNLTSIKDEIFYEVMGLDTHGHCRTYGHGPSPTDVARVKQFEVNQRNIENIRDEIRKEFEEKFAQMEARFELMHRRMETNYPSAASDVAPSIGPSKVCNLLNYR